MTETSATAIQIPAEARAIELLYRALNENRPDLADRVCAPDWQDIPMAPGQQPGPAGLKQLISTLRQVFPDLQIEVHDLVASSGRVAVRASLHGTHLGEIHGVPPTGRKLEVALHEFHRLQDGLITHTWHVEDWFGMLNQVGAWPPANG